MVFRLAVRETRVGHGSTHGLAGHAFVEVDLCLEQVLCTRDTGRCSPPLKETFLRQVLDSRPRFPSLPRVLLAARRWRETGETKQQSCPLVSAFGITHDDGRR